MLGVQVVEETLNLEISRRRLADYVKELNLSACRTCSTIIFPRLSNQVVSQFSGVVVAVAVVVALTP